MADNTSADPYSDLPEKGKRNAAQINRLRTSQEMRDQNRWTLGGKLRSMQQGGIKAQQEDMREKADRTEAEYNYRRIGPPVPSGTYGGLEAGIRRKRSRSRPKARRA